MTRTLYLQLAFMFSVFHLSLAQNTDAELIQSGKQLFQLTCSRCHGMLGNGGTGPSLSRAYLPRASTDEQLANVISNGIPGTGMPSIWMLGESEVKKVIKYVRYLGRGKEEIITGDVENGRILFENSICTSCHIVSGKGGSIGPELTEIGLKRGQNYLAEAINHPGKSKPVDTDGFYKFLVVDVKLKNGITVKGIRLNEDSFSIQIRDGTNTLHSFQKDNIQSIEKQKNESLMPSFTDQFSKSEINDIVAYLSSLK